MISLNFFKGGNLYCLVEEIYEVKYEFGFLLNIGEFGKKCFILIWLLKLNIFFILVFIFFLLLLIY